MSESGPSALSCLERTRSAVLNLLVAIGLGIALSGLILRWRDGSALFRAPDLARRTMLGCLFVLLLASYLSRRIGAGRAALRDPSRREERFYRAHLAAAAAGALAVPLGLAYGWTVLPRLDAVAPFWVAALAMGFLALPRSATLDDLDPPMSPSSDAMRSSEPKA